MTTAIMDDMSNIRDVDTTGIRDGPDPRCHYCPDEVLSHRVDGRGRYTHLVCQLDAERRRRKTSSIKRSAA